MRRSISFFCFLFISFYSLGQQCYPDGVTFMAQGEIDFFSQIYPDCKEIDGDVIIGPDISNLDGLLGITHINGSLTIEGNQNLTSFSGLDSLTNINGSLIINENANLIGFSGLDRLTRIELEFRVTNNSSITNFSGLEQLSFIGGNGSLGFSQDDRAAGTTSIAVSNNTNLVNFVGLESLVEVGTIAVAENPNLVDFDGFENLQEIDGMLFIWGNPVLENVDGLENIERIGSGSHGWYFGNAHAITTNVSIYIADNASLSSIGGLNNLKITDGSIFVTGSSLEGEIFRSILDVGLHTETRTVSTLGTTESEWRFSISGSPNLSLCANQSICNLITNFSYTSFSDNGSGCMSNEEVFESCEDIGAIYHLAFYDVNKNGIYDENEPLIKDVNFQLEPGNISITTNDTTGSAYYLHPDTYTIDLDTSLYSDWYLTTDAESYTVELTPENKRDSLYFGFHPDNLEADVYSHVYSFPFRCDKMASIDVSGVNGGNTVIDNGTLWVEADSNVLQIEFVDIPDTIIGDDLFGWHFTNLYPGYNVKKNINFHMPGPNDFELGNLISIKSKIVYTDNVGSDASSSVYTQIHDCENEHISKQASPVHPNNISFAGEYIYYTIEFQNPHFAPKHILTIEDQIDENLDIESFEVVSSSHPDILVTSIDNSNKVTFDFNEMYIGGYYTAMEESFEKSYVYVVYRIKPLPTTEEYTAIENVADVFLIDNAYINPSPQKHTTNTTQNIIIYSSDISVIFHPVFFDLNEDGLYDFGEPLVNNVNVKIDPGATYSTTNQLTGGMIYLSPGTHTISLDTSSIPDWHLTSDFYEYTFDLDSVGIVDTFYFGIYPNTLYSEINTVLFSQALRCNEFVTMDVLADNIGNTTADGVLWLEVDSSIVNVEYVDEPDTTVGSNLYGWDFSQLYPHQNIKKQIKLKLPGPQDFPIGDSLYFSSTVIYTDMIGTDSISYTYSEILECAYDPNDKLVSPVYPNNYALLDEELYYTIRFQNTGNAEAYNVEIIDKLDENLDVKTFRVISSSHAEVLSTTIDTTNTVSFYFQNIFLPDSTTNLEGSQGYVSYGIRTYPDIGEETVIENYADIYFDFNPPITTNTTENVMLSTFDFDEDGYALWEDCDDTNSNVNPSLEEIAYDGLDNDCDPLTLNDDLDGDGYVLDEDCDDTDAEINPNAEEIVYDGLDNDCNIETLDDDLDQDGYGVSEDCDDTDAGINPGAEEIPNNGIDEDCDGSDLTTSVKEIAGHEISLYPNPVDQELFVSVKGGPSLELVIKVFDLTGKVVQESKLSHYSQSIDMSFLNSGVYIVEVVDMVTGDYIMQRIVKGKW